MVSVAVPWIKAIRDPSFRFPTTSVAVEFPSRYDRLRFAAPMKLRPPFSISLVAARTVSCLAAALVLASATAAQPAGPVISGLEVGAPEVDAGEILLGELNCVACHTASPAILVRLSPKTSPVLTEVGARVRPEFVREWLRWGPASGKPGATMPDPLHGLTDVERRQTADELTHYLASLARGDLSDDVPANRLAREQGRVLFHRVGCVACHAPREAAADVFPNSTGPTDQDTIQFVLKRLEQSSVSLGDVSAKYTRASLARFLVDPLASRPAGRMPSLNLTTNEARALATYLIGIPPTSAADASAATEPFKVDRRKARVGREKFAAFGCAACHDTGQRSGQQPTKPHAQPLMSLATTDPGGCLAEAPPAIAPRYHLSSSQREALLAALRRLAALEKPLPPAAQVTHTMTRLNCYACHSRDGIGGPSPSRFDYFSSLTEADLGDEGRLPPHLSGVGEKLRPEWLANVLTNHGIVRPYMGVRMPQFGVSAVRNLASALHAADAVQRPPPPLVQGELAVGRTLAGTNGLSCITCHRFGPHPALGSSVMDLTQVARRLQPPWFRRYLLDPAALRPGTRMPMFWPDGEATLETILGGDTERQIESLWQYLSEGENAPPPDGVPPPDLPPGASAR